MSTDGTDIIRAGFRQFPRSGRITWADGHRLENDDLKRNFDDRLLEFLNRIDNVFEIAGYPKALDIIYRDLSKSRDFAEPLHGEYVIKMRGFDCVQRAEPLGSTLYQMAMVAEKLSDALSAKDCNVKLNCALEAGVELALYDINYRNGTFVEKGIKSDRDTRSGGSTTGAQNSTKRARSIEIVAGILQEPGINNIDPKQRLKNVTARMKELNHPELETRYGFPAPSTIEDWTEEAFELIRNTP
ncbi:hypothetical protein [Hyphomonas adhaerens]|uniref:hypothetical protein n=1 Tax=Hyphomonas adhaerens TaxID=81029 RepID=UPI0012EB31B2|nr:hypothetical protein [Hyphomonas adhaerens]